MIHTFFGIFIFLHIFFIFTWYHSDWWSFHVFILTQRKWHPYLKKLKLKMNPGFNLQNMIRLVMVFKPPVVYFTSALWCCNSHNFFFVTFPLHQYTNLFICISTFNSLDRRWWRWQQDWKGLGDGLSRSVPMADHKNWKRR